MAFGDALRQQSDGATVVLNVDTSQTAKLEHAEREWRESVGQMSREALKLDLAQDRLKTSLSKYGAESAQAKRATIALKDAEEQAARAADRQTRETNDLARATSRVRSGNASLTRSVAGLAGAYIGVYGLVAGIRSAIAAAKEEQNVMGQTKVALDALGISYDQNIAHIEQVIRAQSKLGFDDEALMQTFQLFVRSTKDVDKALELNALAIDVARGRYIELDQAAQIVNKANLGMSGPLRRLGLDVDKNATRIELLALLTRNYGRAAEEASDTAIAASDRLNVEWENMQEVVGRGLLPVVTELSDRLADYFGDAENQRKVQEKVNEAIETGEQVVRGFGSAIRTLHGILRPFIDAVGGTENAVKLLILAFSISKVLSFVGVLGRLRLAIAVLGPTATTSAAQVVAAENAMGAGALAQLPKIASLRVALAGLGLAAAGVGVVAAGVVGGVAVVKGLSELEKRLIGSATETKRKNAKHIADVWRRYGAAWLKQVWANADPQMRALLKKEFLDRSDYEALQIIGITTSPIVEPGEGRLGGPGTTTGGGRGGGGGGRGGPTEDELTLALARAETTRGTADDRRALERLRAYYARRIRALEARKHLTERQRDELRRLYGEIASVQSQIDSIEAEADRRDEEAQRKRDERERRAREREEERLRRSGALGAAHRPETMLRGEALRERRRQQQEDLRRLREERERERRTQQALTEADFRRLSFEFLTSLHGVVSEFGSNFQSDSGGPGNGAMHSQLWQQTRLMREQTQLTRRLTQGMWHPGSAYGQGLLSAAGVGSGF